MIASSVVTDQDRYRTDEAWARALLAAVPGSVHADISGADAPLVDPADKRALRGAHRTAAVDTESHIAAAVAARRGVPFAAVRVVLDPAHRSLPPAALVSLRRDGSADIGAVLASVRRQPAQLPNLLRIVADVSLAWSTLARGRRRLGHALGFPRAVAERGVRGRHSPDPGAISSRLRLRSGGSGSRHRVRLLRQNDRASSAVSA